MTILGSHLKPLTVRVIHGARTIFPHQWSVICEPAWWIWLAEAPGILLEHERGRLEVPVGQVVLLPAGGTYRVQAVGRPPLLWLKVDVPLLSDVIATLGPLLPQVLPQDDLLVQLAGRADAGSQGATPPGWGEAFAWAAVAAWWSHLPPTVMQELQLAQDGLAPLQPILRTIDEHLADPLPIPAVAAVCGCSVATIGRLMRRYLHTTPTAWIRHRRCMRAGELLSTTTLPIDEIARRCGFANRYLLTRHFVVVTGGVSPARYRKQVLAYR